jgi:CheY-like chemotaxis protein
VKGDAGQLEQVIVNLAINARDAMPHGGTLTIETANVYLDEVYARQHVAVKPGRYVVLAVSDTGVGMDRETQSRAFEPFFTTKEPGRGTGLGLATVYGIVKQSGGNVWVYSEVGRGTTFKIYLPSVGDAGAPEPPRPRVEELEGFETILLVDDEERVLNLARAVLRGHGYTVLAASRADEAVLLSQQYAGRIHLLVVDVVLQGAEGPDLARRLAGARPDLRVLYMSGYTEITAHPGPPTPKGAFLAKPFTPRDLAQRVRAVLDAPRDAPPAAPGPRPIG